MSTYDRLAKFGFVGISTFLTSDLHDAERVAFAGDAETPKTTTADRMPRMTMTHEQFDKP